MLTAMIEDTRKEVVCGILDCFEELLDRLEITIPCADAEEEEERKMDDNSARLYGMEYWSLYEQLEDLLTQSFSTVPQNANALTKWNPARL